MNKELEAFKEIREYLNYILYNMPGTRAISYTSTSGYLEPFMTQIENALKEHEKLQQVLDDFGIYNTMNLISTLKTINYLETRHVLTAKKTRALEIIKEKDVSPIDIRCCETVEQYNVKENGFIRLTKEEFDLLKEVLDYE